jgi:flavin reductase (DIM6/NTAB) family NADH-FMN oxidoreductase RutF
MDPKRFREVLGQYPTGVVVVTALSASGEALGMTVGSFTSVSLDPPLVAFLPDKASSSWKAIRESGPRFCVNFLSAQQEDVCRAVASRKVKKFNDIPWHPSAAGNPIIDGAVAYVDCTVEKVHDAGDHHIVIGRAHDLELTGGGYPLLFFRGGYGSFRPASLAAGDADLVEQLRLVDRVRATMEELADRFESEVTVVCLLNDELVLTAAAGHSRSPDAPARVGGRMPFMPPAGAVNVAWGPEELRERWLAYLHPDTSPEEAARMRRAPDLVRSRGFNIILGHELSAEIERAASAHASERDPDVSPRTLRELIKSATAFYNPESLDDYPCYELRAVSAPVFNKNGEVAFTLTLWGPPGRVDRATVDEYARELLKSTAAATAAIGGAAPASHDERLP